MAWRKSDGLGHRNRGPGGPARRSRGCDALHCRRGAKVGKTDDRLGPRWTSARRNKHHIFDLSSSFNHLNWKKTEVIFADTPGYTAFLPETLTTLRAVDGVVMLISPGRH